MEISGLPTLSPDPPFYSSRYWYRAQGETAIRAVIDHIKVKHEIKQGDGEFEVYCEAQDNDIGFSGSDPRLELIFSNTSLPY